MFCSFYSFLSPCLLLHREEINSEKSPGECPRVHVLQTLLVDSHLSLTVIISWGPYCNLPKSLVKFSSVRNRDIMVHFFFVFKKVLQYQLRVSLTILILNSQRIVSVKNCVSVKNYTKYKSTTLFCHTSSWNASADRRLALLCRSWKCLLGLLWTCKRFWHEK